MPGVDMIRIWQSDTTDPQWQIAKLDSRGSFVTLDGQESKEALALLREIGASWSETAGASKWPDFFRGCGAGGFVIYGDFMVIHRD